MASNVNISGTIYPDQVRGVIADTSIRYDSPQNLLEMQRAQARANLGVDVNLVLTQSLTSGNTTQAPSSDAVFDAVSAREALSNKVTALTLTSTDDQYPSAAAVVSALSRIVVNVADYFVGNLTFVDPRATSYAARNAAPDITSAVQLAINAASVIAQTQKTSVWVKFPSGLYNLSSTLMVYDNIRIYGAGASISPYATHLRRTGNYGHTILCGVYGPTGSIYGARIDDILIYQDYGYDGGYGFFPPPSGALANATTNSSHVIWTSPNDCGTSGVKIYGLQEQMQVLGGNGGYWDGYTYGIWDPTNAARQQSNVGFRLDAKQNTDLTYDVPTNHKILMRTNGFVEAGNVTYPGGNVLATVVNKGPKIGILIASCEESQILEGSNFSASSGSNVVIDARAGVINQGLTADMTTAPCGPLSTDAMIKRSGAGEARDIKLRVTALGQGNTLRLFTDEGAGETAGFELSGTGSTFIGNPIKITNMFNYEISMALRNWNIQNWYTGDDACGVLIGSNCRSGRVTGILGGSATGKTTGHFCVDGVRAANAVSNNLTVDCTNGGLLGYLHLANDKAIDRLLDDGSFNLVGAGSFTYSLKTSPKTIWVNAPLSAQQDVTLPSTNVPTGWRIRVKRASAATGAFNSVWGPLVLSTPDTSGTLIYLEGTGWVVE